jgi:hypothetical protein
MVGARKVNFCVTVNLRMAFVMHLDVSDNTIVAVLRKVEGIGAKCEVIGIDAVGKYEETFIDYSTLLT